MVTEFQRIEDWWKQLQKQYPIEKTFLRDTEECFRVLFSPTDKETILIGVYCRVTGKGVILDRRKEIRNEEK